MLGRTLFRGFSRARAGNLNANFAQRRTFLGGSAPTSLRNDGLLVVVAMGVIQHYVPQDIAALTLLIANHKSQSSCWNIKQRVDDVEKEFEGWQSARGLKGCALLGGGSCYEVKLR